ncbi:MAG TPA: hypothetical protein VGX50_05855, partial [Longimicrobium sp.]|nr:hypothetical protein [Longimicrobium sp.]
AIEVLAAIVANDKDAQLPPGVILEAHACLIQCYEEERDLEKLRFSVHQFLRIYKEAEASDTTALHPAVHDFYNEELQKYLT